MKAVFGLGNPGLGYVLSRHNVGFQVIDLYRRVHRLRRKGTITAHSLVYRTDELLLVKPLTYMNSSGRAVQAVLAQFNVALGDALVAYDDLDFPLGAMRILAAGGPGSHNGMRSVLASLGSEGLPRLRIGIGTDSRPEDSVDYVLGRFTPREWEALFPVLERAVEAIEAFSTCDVVTLMNRFNRRGSPIAAEGDASIIL